MFDKILFATLLLLPAGGAWAQELVERWFQDCGQLASRSPLLNEWLAGRGGSVPPRGCFVVNRSDLLILEARGANPAGVSYADLRRKGHREVYSLGDDEVVQEFAAVNGKHYVLLRTAQRGDAKSGYSMVSLRPRRGGESPFRVEPLLVRGPRGLQRVGDGNGAGVEFSFAGDQGVFGEPKLLTAGGQVAAIQFPWVAGEAPLVYEFRQGAMHAAAVDLEGFTQRVQRRFPGVRSRSF